MENTCSEGDLRSRIFGTFVVKFLACLTLLGFLNYKKMVQLPIFNGFLLYKDHLEFSGAFFLAKVFEKVSLDAYNFLITSLSARISEQMKSFREQKYADIYRLNIKIRSTMLCLSVFELYSRWVPLNQTYIVLKLAS